MLHTQCGKEPNKHTREVQLVPADDKLVKIDARPTVHDAL